MTTVHGQCWRVTSYPAPTKRSIWILFLILLAAQIFWQSQIYDYIAYSLAVYRTRNSGPDDRPNPLDTNGHPQSRHELQLTSDGGPLDKADHQSRFLRALQVSFMAEYNMTGSQERRLKVVPGQEGACRGCRALQDAQRSILKTAILKYFTLHKNNTRDTFVNLHRYGYLLDSAACSEGRPDLVILVHSKFDHFDRRSDIRTTWARVSRASRASTSQQSQHEYGYLLDSAACSEGRPDLVILVHSKFDHFDRRSEIRTTWASNRTVNGVNIRTVFLLGQPGPQPLHASYSKNNPKTRVRKGRLLLAENGAIMAIVMDKINEESEVFGDIVMGNFTDSYRNLTIKHIMAFDWVTTRCPQVWYIAKVDDDVMVNTFEVSTYISQSKNNSGVLVCKIATTLEAQRKKHSKWFVSSSEYPFPVYPPWCMGYGLLVTRDVVQQLLAASRDMKSYWIDDVYVTGLLRLKAGLSMTSISLTRHKTGPMFVLRNFIKNKTYVGYWQGLVAANRALG